ncbi:hypothetical protein [Paraburkholderia tagetis]|uniref:Uncharacterized protein n=1 Tax=Paraburkholderia tagetis TaxID=2913261 RepID=A0A9X1UL12_9BURK|nr:hypothetical protein [Paraburkholderia tagetis]MCG5076961.1 hypothetical protein [Paraburkholderia tagetis]
MIRGLISRRALCAALLMATLAACASDAAREAFLLTETGLEAARRQAIVECATPGECAQAWERARAFVQSHTPTPIERITDETIETGMPHEFGVAYFWAVRHTVDDATTTIRLKGMCRGMYGTRGGPGWMYRRCATQLRDAELEFAREFGSAR